MNQEPHPPLRDCNWQPPPPSEKILKAIIAAGILANPENSWQGIESISYQVNEIYLGLFGNNETH